MDPTSHVPLKPDAFHILLVLLDGPRHGYALLRDIARSTGGQVVLLPGALYRRLQQLLDDGLIEETDDGSPTDSRRRTLGVTPFGRAVAEAEAARLEDLLEAARLRDLVKERAEAKS
ncbi:MAG: helix-turn-helix transcriptional regulator [Gemmatimonadetes bacterium]|nr:helix-turn-helix transcriptional regulator [Gemmatimonadota bacterium]